MGIVQLQNLWTYIQSLSLSKSNRKWLSDHLIEANKVAEKAKDDSLMTKEEFFARVDEAMEQAKRGEVYRFENNEEMFAWLESL